MYADAVARIRTTALCNNLDLVRRSAPDCSVLAVIKADAYGHGLETAAAALADADAFGVARFPEAGALRQAGFSKDILVMSGHLAADSLGMARDLDLQVVAFDESHLDALLAGPSQTPVRVWLKIDTGMGRLGIAPGQFAETLQRLRDCPGIDPDICLMTHLACADDLESSVTREQLQVFADTVGDWQGDISIANSAGILGWPASLQRDSIVRYAGRNWVRPGLMLYGVSPLLGRTAGDLGLEPVMLLEGSLLSVRDIAAGARVGYAAEWQAQRDSRVGVVNVGYADGYPWRLSGRGHVRVGEREAPVIGRVSMDMLSVDLTEIPDVGVGVSVEVWGERPTVGELAGLAETSPYELLTGLGRRVRRVTE